MEICRFKNLFLFVILIVQFKLYARVGEIQDLGQKAFKGIVVANKRKKIILGSTLPLSGGLCRLGKDFSSGIGIVFNAINRKGGIHGYLLRHIIRDDHYEPFETKNNINKLLKKTSILFGTLGSDSLTAIDLDDVDNTLFLFPNAGVSKFRDKKYSNIFFYRASTEQEVEALIYYAVKELCRKRIAIFYEDSLWGNDGFGLAKKYLKKLGLTPVASALYQRNTVSVVQAADTIAKKEPDTIICISNYRPTYNFIQKIINKGLANCKFLGVSETSLIQGYLKKSRGIRLITTSIVPNPWKSSLPIAQKYRKAMKKYLPNYQLSLMSFEGYIISSLFVACLKRLSLPITRKKIVAVLNSFKNINFEGLEIDFDSSVRSFSKVVWINEGRKISWKKFDSTKFV